MSLELRTAGHGPVVLGCSVRHNLLKVDKQNAGDLGRLWTWESARENPVLPLGTNPFIFKIIGNFVQGSLEPVVLSVRA
jgi:hypothetical protein